MAGPTEGGRERVPGPEADPETVTALRLQQVACQAALASTGRVVQPSMREFLR